MNSLAVRKAQEASAELRGKAKVEYVDADIKKVVEDHAKKQAEAMEAAKKAAPAGAAPAPGAAPVQLRAPPQLRQRRRRRRPDRRKIQRASTAGRLLQAARSVSWGGHCRRAGATHGQARPSLAFAPASLPDVPEVPGVRFATAEAGIRYKGRTDLLLGVMAPGTRSPAC